MNDKKKRTPRKPVQAGERFGRLVTQEKKHRMSGSQKVTIWVCVCDCGTQTTVTAANLTNNHTKSCGCLHSEVCADLLRTHGDTDSITHKRWAAMKSRCLIEGDSAYRHYGARGVTICDEWLVYENFLADMGECPDGWTLDRIDNAKGYEKGNCRWASYKQQANNKTSNRVLSAFGEQATLTEWAEKMGIKMGTLRSRISRSKWSVEKALTTPVGAVNE